MSIRPIAWPSWSKPRCRHVGVRVLITADRFKTSDYVGMLCELLPPPPADGAIAAANLPDLRAVAMGPRCQDAAL